MIDPNFGTDIELGPGGFLGGMHLVSGRRNLILALYRRWSTSDDSVAGKGIYGGLCVDIRMWFAAPLSAGRVGDLARRIVTSGQADERVSAVEARVRFESAQKKLMVAVNVTPTEGPAFNLVLSTDGVTVEILGDGNELG